jgi:hypothetical protein
MLLNAGAAIVPSDKLRDYLLSSTHPIGRYKSAVFRSLGYAQDHWRFSNAICAPCLLTRHSHWVSQNMVKNSVSEAL